MDQLVISLCTKIRELVDQLYGGPVGVYLERGANMTKGFEAVNFSRWHPIAQRAPASSPHSDRGEDAKAAASYDSPIL